MNPPLQQNEQSIEHRLIEALTSERDRLAQMESDGTITSTGRKQLQDLNDSIDRRANIDRPYRALLNGRLPTSVLEIWEGRPRSRAYPTRKPELIALTKSVSNATEAVILEQVLNNGMLYSEADAHFAQHRRHWATIYRVRLQRPCGFRAL